MHLAAVLVAEERGRLVVAQRQVAIGTGAVEVRLILEGTGHGTQRVAFLAFLFLAQHEHTVLVVVPVTADFVEVALCHEGGLGELPAAALFLVLDKALQKLNHSCALGEHDGQSLTDIVHRHEEFQLASEFVVVALFGFFEHREMFFQHRRLGEGHAINAAEHFIFSVAAPVSARAVGELEGFDGGNRHEMGTGAEVGEFTLLVEGDVLALVGVFPAKLDFVGFFHVFEQLHSFVGREFKALDGHTALDNGFHLGFNRGEVVGGKGLFHVEIVVETAVNGRSDGEFRGGIQSSDRLREDMRRAMPEGFFAVDIVKREDFHLTIAVRHRAKVADNPVHLGGAGSFEKSRADGFGDVRNRHAGFKFFHVIF